MTIAELRKLFGITNNQALVLQAILEEPGHCCFRHAIKLERTPRWVLVQCRALSKKWLIWAERSPDGGRRRHFFLSEGAIEGLETSKAFERVLAKNKDLYQRLS